MSPQSLATGCNSTSMYRQVRALISVPATGARVAIAADAWEILQMEFGDLIFCTNQQGGTPSRLAKIACEWKESRRMKYLDW